MPEAPFNQAEFIANRFGGRQQLADAIGQPRHKIDYWCRRLKHIPEEARPTVLLAAQDLRVDVTAFDFIRHLVKLDPASLAA